VDQLGGRRRPGRLPHLRGRGCGRAGGDRDPWRWPEPHPSLRRTSVEAWAATWAEQEERRREEGARRQTLSRPSDPSQDGHVWLSRTETAKVLGVSPSRVSELTGADKIPATRAGHRHRYRRDHVEQLAAARAFTARRAAV
jgi:excisionase family DNA binding protein